MAQAPSRRADADQGALVNAGHPWALPTRRESLTSDPRRDGRCGLREQYFKVDLRAFDRCRFDLDLRIARGRMARRHGRSTWLLGEPDHGNNPRECLHRGRSQQFRRLGLVAVCVRPSVDACARLTRSAASPASSKPRWWSPAGDAGCVRRHHAHARNELIASRVTRPGVVSVRR